MEMKQCSKCGEEFKYYKIDEFDKIYRSILKPDVEFLFEDDKQYDKNKNKIKKGVYMFWALLHETDIDLKKWDLKYIITLYVGRTQVFNIRLNQYSNLGIQDTWLKYYYEDVENIDSFLIPSIICSAWEIKNKKERMFEEHGMIDLFKPHYNRA